MLTEIEEFGQFSRSHPSTLIAYRVDERTQTLTARTRAKLVNGFPDGKGKLLPCIRVELPCVRT